MGDHFALLGEPRRPWLDQEALKQKFLSASASVHPDRIHNASPAEKQSANQHFAELNMAFNCLREPKDRLRHLLELETGAKPKDLQDIPPDLAELFLEVAQLRQDAKRFVVERAKADSPLLRVQFFERAQEWIESLNNMQGRLKAQEEDLLTSLLGVDRQWQQMGHGLAQRRELLGKIENIYRLLSFNTRWSLQLQETIVHLMF
jgi:DnaJ-domain-containing protein 1